MGKRVTGIKGKHMLTALMSIIMALALVMVFNVTVFAAGGTVGSNAWKWNLDESTGELTLTGWNKTKVDSAPWLEGYTDKVKKVVLKEVVTLDGELFKDCTNLTEVDLSNDGKDFKALKELSGNVFAGCTGLKEITIPKTLETVSNSTETKGPFTGSGLEKIVFSDGLEVIPSFICAGCTSLNSITFPQGVTKIRQKSFSKCTALTEVTIPKTVVSISGETTGPFANCTGLTTVTFENGLTEIPDRMFKDCLSITTINWPEGLTTIGSFAFQNARDYTVGSLPATVTAVKTDAFEGCKDTSFTVPKNMTTFQHPFGHLTEISFEEGTRKIPDNCCESVTTLKKINWPANVTEVGDYAFYINLLDEIIIPDTVTKVGKYAFAKSQDHTAKVYIPDSLKSYGEGAFSEMAINMIKYSKVVVTGTSNSKAKEIVEKNKSGKYSYTYKEIVVPTKGKTYTVGDVKYKMTNAALDGTGTVAVAGFSGKTLKSVTIPKTVKVGDASFKVTAINANTFKGMRKLTKITIKSTTITSVKKNAFKGINTKAKIKVPKAKLSKYKTLFKKSGLSKKVKVSK